MHFWTGRFTASGFDHKQSAILGRKRALAPKTLAPTRTFAMMKPSISEGTSCHMTPFTAENRGAALSSHSSFWPSSLVALRCWAMALHRKHPAAPSRTDARSTGQTSCNRACSIHARTGILQRYTFIADAFGLRMRPALRQLSIMGWHINLHLAAPAPFIERNDHTNDQRHSNNQIKYLHASNKGMPAPTSKIGALSCWS